MKQHRLFDNLLEQYLNLYKLLNSSCQCHTQGTIYSIYLSFCYPDLNEGLNLTIHWHNAMSKKYICLPTWQITAWISMMNMFMTGISQYHHAHNHTLGKGHHQYWRQQHSFLLGAFLLRSQLVAHSPAFRHWHYEAKLGWEYLFCTSISIPLSGMRSLQGNASGVMECWYTRAVKLPVVRNVTRHTQLTW